MRSPNQGLGSIPVSKKWGSGIDPRVYNILLWDWSLRIQGPIPDHMFMNFGNNPRTQNSLQWDLNILILAQVRSEKVREDNWPFPSVHYT